MRLRTPRKRTTALAALLTLALAAPLTASTNASASPPDRPATAAVDEDIRQYEIHGPSSPADRTAIAATGVSMDEVHDHSVVVSADPAQARTLRKLGHSLKKLAGPPARTGGKARKAGDFPPADSGYHNYAEMNAEINELVADYPSIVSKQVIGKSYEGRDIVAVKISDNVAHRRGRARGALHRPPARPRAPHRRDGALPAAPVQRRVRHRLPDHQPGRRPRDLDHLRPQPGRRRVRHRHRHLPLLAQEPPAQLRLVGRRHRPEPQLGLQVGLLRRLVAAAPARETYRGASAFSAPEAQVVRDFVRSRVVGGVQQIKAAHRLPHLRRAGAVALRLHLRRHRRPA